MLTERVAPSQVVVFFFLILKVVEVTVEPLMSWLK